MSKKRIILITPENQDKFKVGGLGKITKLLETGLREDGVEVKVVAPEKNIYGPLSEKKTEVENRKLGLEAVALANDDFKPDWFWVHDWGGVWSASEVKKYLPKLKVIWTVHSPILLSSYGGTYGGYGYENYSGGDKPIDWGDSFFDFGGLIREGIEVADKISAVSKTFAKNIQRNSLFEGAKEIAGINNGMDLGEWKMTERNKAKLQIKMGLPVIDVPIFVFISRLVPQKGLELLARVLPKFLAQNRAQFIFLGGGNKYWTGKIKSLERKFGNKLRANLVADFEMPKEVLAGADYLVLPSIAEPFGLVVAEAKRMGVVPIVHLVDGLVDQVKDGVTGLGFEKYGAEELEEKLVEAVARYQSEWQKRVMRANISGVESYRRMTSEYLAFLYE